MSCADPAAVTAGAVLHRLGALGGFFTMVPVGTGDPGSTDEPVWRPLADLVGPPGPFAVRVAQAREGFAERAGLPLAAVDARATASLVHLGLVARLVSPALAAAAVFGVVLDPFGDGWQWREPGPGDYALGLAGREPVGAQPPLGSLAERITDRLIEPVLLPLEDVAHAAGGVSRRVLRGNLASALAGAVTALDLAAPGTRALATPLVAALIAGPHLAGHGGPGPTGAFRRRSCCLYYRLYYRLPGGGLCGDCVLAR